MQGRGVARSVFVRRYGGGQEKDAIETELSADAEDRFHMTPMDGIERTSEDADSHVLSAFFGLVGFVEAGSQCQDQLVETRAGDRRDL